MKPIPLTLQEATRLLEALSAEEAEINPQIVEFTSLVEDTGKDLLQRIPNGEQYVEDAANFLSAAVMAECCNNPTPDAARLFDAMSKYPRLFQLALGYAFIYAVGLVNVEELR